MAATTYKIKLNRQLIEDSLRKSIVEVSCDLQLTMASEISLVIHDPNYKIADSDRFKLGAELDMEIGFQSQFHRLMLGEIVSLEPGFSESLGTFFIVRAFDKSYRLRRNKPARPAFLNVRDSDIASQLAREAGLQAEVERTPIIHEYLQQTGSDWRFLKNRAEANGYELFVQFNRLFFRRPDPSKTAPISLKRGRDLIRLNLRLSAVDQPNLHVVRGWDARQKKPLVAKATPPTFAMAAAGTKTGAQLTARAFGESRSITFNTPVFSQNEAEQLVKAQFSSRAKHFIQGEGLCRGMPEMKAGHKIDLLNMGKRFSGLYYLTRVTHLINKNGYRTQFSMERNAV
ncbi:MAG: phage late control D family protein [Candidatus Thorarchaeota archaeon]